MLFGINDHYDILLACLNISPGDIPRFRDCFIRDDMIVIYTRTGGGNRHFYDSEPVCRQYYPEYFDNEDCPMVGPWNEDLRQNPYYIRDEDCTFDCTYAYFFFKFPPEFEEDLKALCAGTEPYTPSERWQELFKDINKL